LNPDGSTGTALVVYHPGRSGFQEMFIHAFSEGLVSNGWRVEISTVSKETPTDLSGYDLLVLSAPTYDWVPAKPIPRYLERLGDLEGQPTAVILSAAGTTTLSVPTMEEMVREANGDLVASYTLWTLIPNRLRYGIDDAEEIMHQAAQAIPVPGE
jgi:flavorubredoxin